MLMSIIFWCVLGLLAGFIANEIVSGRGEGVFLDITLGIVGALQSAIEFGEFCTSAAS